MALDLDIEEVLVGLESKQEIASPLSGTRLSYLLMICLFLPLIFIFRSAYLQIEKGQHYQQMAQENSVRLDILPAPRGLILDRYFNPLATNQQLVRLYPAAEVAAHIVGYGDKAGLEFWYNDYLKGQDGQRKVEVNSLDQEKRVISLQDPQIGNSLVLHLDLDLQKKVYELLPPDKKSAVVAIDINSGGVLSLVSKPSFDNNLIKEEFAKFNNNPDKPFFNRVISGQYPPGSTFKIVVAAAALQEGLITPEEKKPIPEKIKITNPYNPDIVYVFPDWKKHGRINFFEALRESSNVYFYGVGEDLGWKQLKRYSEEFALGEKLNIDLTGEAAGYIPSKGWLGDLYHASIGQGDVKLTVLQLAMITASIANGGQLYQPQLVDKIIDKDDNLVKDILPQVINSNFISSGNLDLLKKGMDFGDNIYGKTGTAQFSGHKDKYHSWFTSFSGDIAVTVLIEEGGRGSAAALPIAREIINYYHHANN